MMYVCRQEYRHFRGYVFSQGKPTEITDRATLDLIQREPDFEPWKGGDPVGEEERQGRREEALLAPAVTVLPYIAPKKRGWPKGKPRK